MMNPKTHRRAMATLPVVASPIATAAFAATGPDAELIDAELLRLGEEFERRYAAFLPVDAECDRLKYVFEEAWKRTELSSIDANLEFWSQMRIETGFEAAIEAQNRSFDDIDTVTTKIRETPAKTFAGLAVKARALRYDTYLSTQCNLPEEDQDWAEFVMNQFVAELERLAAAALNERTA
jgi:hypothetical protein